MAYTFLIPFIFITTVIIYLYVPLVGLYRYYRPTQHKFWVNVLWVILTMLTWPLVPIILVIRRRDVVLNLLLWGAFIVWLLALTIYISQNLDYMLAMTQQYYNMNGN